MTYTRSVKAQAQRRTIPGIPRPLKKRCPSAESFYGTFSWKYQVWGTTGGWRNGEVNSPSPSPLPSREWDLSWGIGQNLRANPLQVLTDLGRSCVPACWGFPNGGGSLPTLPYVDYTRGSAHALPVLSNIHPCEGVLIKRCASFEYNRLANGVFWHPAQSVFPAVFKYKRYRCSKVLAACRNGFTLAVGAGYLRAIGDEPPIIFFNDCGKFIMHTRLPLPHNPASVPADGIIGDAIYLVNRYMWGIELLLNNNSMLFNPAKLYWGINR